MPAAFKDKQGRVWTLELNAPLIRRIHQTLGVNLVDLKSDPIVQLETEAMKLVDVIWMIVAGEAQKLGVTEEEFGASCAGGTGEFNDSGEEISVIDNALEALADAVVNFSPSGRRSLMRSLREQGRRVLNRTGELTLKKAEAMEDQTAEKIATAAVTEMNQKIQDLTKPSSSGEPKLLS